MTSEREKDVGVEVMYCETTEERMFGNKKVTVTVRANRPSKEALRRYGECIIRMVQELDENKKLPN